MLTPALVLTNKNCGAGWTFSVCVTAVCLWLMGCSPPGPRLLLQGKQSMEEGRYEEAVERLEKATELLPKNSLAWNYLGLAYHANHQLDEAAKAYRLALSLDHKLIAVRYNLGCLYLEQGSYPAAIDELRSYTLLQPNAVEGWIKQGTALLRARRLEEAEKSFRVALDLQARHPEALNGLGLIQVQRRRLQDALNHFNVAALQDPPYGPALLNSAIINQQLNNPNLALQRYRQYLAQQPRPSDADSVASTVRQLEMELNPPPVASRTAVNTSSVPASAKVKISPAQVGSGSNSRTSSIASLPPQTAPSRTNAPVAVASTKPVVPPNPKLVSPSNSAGKVPLEASRQPIAKPVPTKGAEALAARPAELEVTQLQSNLVVRPAQELTRSSAPAATIPADSSTEASQTSTNSAKRGFFSRLNPFGGRNKSGANTSTAQPSSAVTTPESVTSAQAGARYSYLSPAAPSAGDRSESEKAFKRGLKAQKSGSRSLAITEYQAALKADPANYDAYYNLGLAALEGGDVRLSLWAYEIALALKPAAEDARYNFALALKAGGYWQDAVEQLEKLIANDNSDARSHLSLGNLYSQQLQQPSLAREHYQRLLELNPRHPEASKIRYWLAANP